MALSRGVPLGVRRTCRRGCARSWCHALTVALVAAGGDSSAMAREAPRGVLHIIADDLRSELGAYGLENRSTPHLDGLAASGTVFLSAYAQIAVCAPSRNSFLTGRRPDRSRCWNFINSFREDHPEWTTIPGNFLRNGGTALGVGKVFHPMIPPAYDGNLSWSDAALPFKNPCWNTADDPHAKFQDGGLPCIFCSVDIAGRVLHGNVSVANEFCQIDAVEDTITVDLAVKHLEAIAFAVSESTSALPPFYLAVGVHKPHMPWQAAPEDWAAHPLENVDLARNPLPPHGMPDVAFHFSDGVDSGVLEHTDPWHPLTDTHARAARRAYRAAVTGVDRKLGVLLDELDRLNLSSTTAVVVHGDHGWSLSEQGLWRKMSNYENAVRVPLIIRVPWLPSAPRRSAALVELVDLAPTIWELAGVPRPAMEAFDGISLVPLLAGAQPSIKSAAFSQYPRRVTNTSAQWKDNSIIHKNRSTFTHMGMSIRTESWRLTQWVRWNQSSLSAEWDAVEATELYDHRNTTLFPVRFDLETVNVATVPEVQDVVRNLSAQLRAAFGGPVHDHTGSAREFMEMGKK